MGDAANVPLEQVPDVWRIRRGAHAPPATPTGHAKLDNSLPGCGWPLGALTELLADAPGSGEFSLLMPLMARLTAQRCWIMLVDPPWVPYPPAMRGHGVTLERVLLIRTSSADESLWACEQVLRETHGGAVLTWHENPSFTHLRRLQLAARAERQSAFLFRPLAAAAQSSPATLRLRLDTDTAGMRVTVLKCRGQRPSEPLLIRRSTHLPGFVALPSERSETTAHQTPAPSETARAERPRAH